MKEITVTQEFLEQFSDRHIFLGWPGGSNSPWLKIGQVIKLYSSVEIENNAGLYAPNYRALVGGISTSGLCSMGFMSYSHSPLPDGARVGRYCSISDRLSFLDVQHPTDMISTSLFAFRTMHPLTAGIEHREKIRPANLHPTLGKPYPVIGHDVWIGTNVSLSLGIKIGTGAIIAANSVVTKDVPPYAIVAGNPARVKRFRFPEATIERLLVSEWWQYCYTAFEGMPFDNVEKFIDLLDEKRAGGLKVMEYSPLRISID